MTSSPAAQIFIRALSCQFPAWAIIFHVCVCVYERASACQVAPSLDRPSETTGERVRPASQPAWSFVCFSRASSVYSDAERRWVCMSVLASRSRV
jgi:hypothetical protein